MQTLADAIPVTPDSLYGVMGVLAFLLTIGVQVWTMFRGRNPQPFTVREDTEYVAEESYHTHCKINRDEHRRIESKFDSAIKDIQGDHNALAREVSAVTAASEMTSARLTQMDQKLDKILAIARQPNNS